MAHHSPWPKQTTPPPLPHDEVHVWSVELARPSAELAALTALLSPDEQARAAKFHFAEDREHYIVGRGVLRLLISQYQAIEPTAVQFVYGAHGKPALAGDVTSGDLHFNLSNAQGVALIGVARGREVGVDVEVVRPLADAARVARRFFSEAEVAAYTAVPDTQKPEAFFNCWTRKEAFIKAIGEGLSCPLKSFDVTLRPGEPAHLLAIRGSQQAAAQWTLHSLSPFPGYVGAIMVKKGDWQLRCWEWGLVASG